MAFYGDVSKAETMAGVPSGSVTVEMQDVINEFIEAHIKQSGFEESEMIDEYYDIKKSGQSELILKNFPIIEVDELVNGFLTSAEFLTEGEDFVVDSDSGIIQLLKKKFYIGYNSVKVIYKHGYAQVPSLIIQIATLMAAKWAKIKSTSMPVSEDGEILKSIRIADYSETYDLGFMNIKSEYDEMLLPMIKKAKEYYAAGV